MFAPLPDVEAAEVAPVSLAELPVPAEDAFKPEVGVLVADTRVPVLVLFRIAVPVDVVTLTTDSVVDRRPEDEVALIKDALEDVGGKLEILVLAEKKDEAELELGVASVKDEESWPHAVMESAKRRNADDNFIRKVNDHRMITLRINTSGRWKIPDFTKVWCAPVSRQKLELTGAPNSNSRNAELEEEEVNIAGRGRGPSKKFSPKAAGRVRLEMLEHPFIRNEGLYQESKPTSTRNFWGEIQMMKKLYLQATFVPRSVSTSAVSSAADPTITSLTRDFWELQIDVDPDAAAELDDEQHDGWVLSAI
ncbi:hypothetical protein F5876DRAFT_69471 [Lentinula aff. lateritia]|uniref:Uncharacterized protein n=1 Tax=Lentinula aff. lateritia TaxID=2804960 RepID=A0ACC1TMK0_9AGAR|nr:hypothetical protein F5876DRAFT_69471 [Lentinula aff. lateritia]